MRFHYLARGIALVDKKVLLAHQIGASNTFLPGGHIEIGETAESALIREIREEIGKTAIVKRFIGAAECMWPKDNPENHEINLLFEVIVPDLSSAAPPESLEAHLEFVWSDPVDLESHNLQPFPLIECLKNLENNYSGFWATSSE